MIDPVVDPVEEHVDLDGSQFFESIVERWYFTRVSQQNVTVLASGSLCLSRSPIIDSWFSSWSAMDFPILLRSTSSSTLNVLLSWEETYSRAVFRISRIKCLNRSLRSFWRTEFFAKELTLISWERYVFLPSCMLSGRPDLSRIGFGVGWVGLGTFCLTSRSGCRATSPSDCRATIEPNSLFHSCFNEIFGGGRDDMFTFSYKTSPVVILKTFGIQ